MALGCGLVGVLLVVRLATLVSTRHRAIGDGRNTPSYGFAMTPADPIAAEIVASGMAKDGLQAMHDPAVWTLAQLDAATERRRGRYLVPGDRVAGVVVNGEARAYPLRLLEWHEVINDTLASQPIAVTYNPLCDSIVAFDRTISGETRSFGVSGLLLESNLLLYDRHADRTRESLWWQVGLRAVAGPATGTRVTPLPVAVIAWSWWRELHPDTSVVAPDAAFVTEGKRAPYTSYFGSDELRFPLRRRPPADGATLKEPSIAVRVADHWFAATLADIARAAGAAGVAKAEAAGVRLTFTVRPELPGVVVTPALPTVVAFRFAWYSAHSDDTTWLFR